ncbi:alpha/beta hydrolase [Microbacterium trichothecenolyticum]|uniref:Alpha/beta hydrolase n=1 Tax=Microbacterium ureisolvens TaxID=2781186 RepID=A0ABS7I108_9MICO|nr:MULTISPECIES: alpha/beta hydrolase [Microbacterium]MBW9110809.1 alpha/beta hydrolase [Microbacterium ureisolvens]MBW9120960.1 alpha/beta hydrolase [Microbacterium trichothecenolyticum]
MTDTTQIFEPDGRAIPYIVEGDGPIGLVLIAEPGQDALGVVGHYLAEEAGFHIIRVGYRASVDAASTGDQADDVVAVIDELGLERTWVGGHGRGGTVARALVARHPERVNGLLLLGVEDEDIALAPVIPVLIVQGADDEVTPPAAGERLRATAPERASVKTLDGAGHLFPLTHPVETAVIVEEYLDWD